MIRAIIFDCFGVLVTEGWLAFKEEYFSHDPELLREAIDIKHQADRGLISREQEIETMANLASISPQKFKQAIGGNAPNEKLFDYINELKPKYKIGFLSNISENSLHKMFTDDQLAVFDSLTLSYKLGFIKPEAEAYEAAANDLEVEVSEAIMIDDQLSNVEGARAAGMQAILYQNFDQLKTELEPTLAA